MVGRKHCSFTEQGYLVSIGYGNWLQGHTEVTLSASSGFFKLHCLLLMQAASQSRLEEINAAEAMFRKQQRQRIAALTSEMERAQSMHQESLRQIAHWQAGLDVSEKLFLVGEDIRRSLANKYDE